MAPPKAALAPKALEIIIPNILGTKAIFLIIINKATSIYIVAIIGTILEDTFAILLTPPKMTIPVMISNITPTIIGLRPKALSKELAIVLA